MGRKQRRRQREARQQALPGALPASGLTGARAQVAPEVARLRQMVEQDSRLHARR